MHISGTASGATQKHRFQFPSKANNRETCPPKYCCRIMEFHFWTSSRIQEERTRTAEAAARKRTGKSISRACYGCLYGPISPCSNQALIVVGVNVAPRGDAVRIAKIRLSYMQGIFSQSRRPCEMKNFALTNFAERCSIHFGPEYRNHPGRAGVLGPGIAAKSNSVHFQAVRLMRMIFNNSLFDGLIPRAPRSLRI